MKVIKTVYSLGEFWLPENPSKVVHGTLEIKKDCTIIVSALGKLIHRFDELLPIVHGKLENGNIITLIDVFSQHFPLSEKSHLRVRSAIYGCHISDKNFRLSNLSFSMEGLRFLLPQTGLESKKIEDGHCFLYKQQEKISLRISNNMNLDLIGVANYHIDRNNFEIKTSIAESCIARLYSDEAVDHAQFFLMMYNFSAFMNVIGSMRSHIYDIKATCDDTPITFYLRPRKPPLFKNYVYEIEDNLANFLNEHLESVFVKWCKIYKFKKDEIHCFLMAKQELYFGHRVYVFLDIMKCLESISGNDEKNSLSKKEIRDQSKIIYDGIKKADKFNIIRDIEEFTVLYIKRQTSMTLKQKMSYLLTNFSSDIFDLPVLSKDFDKFIDKIVTTRNAFTHLSKFTKDRQEELYPEYDLLEVSNFLIIIATYKFLTDLDIEKSCIKSFIHNELKQSRYLPEFISNTLNKNKSY